MYDDQWDAATDRLYGSAELWGRLIGGDCDRVVVLGPAIRRSMLELYFPQTLGLPPLRYSIGYSRAERLGANADEAAATDRWIVEGEEWAPQFMPRADAIISVETARVAAIALISANAGLTPFGRWKRQALGDHRRRKEAHRPGISIMDAVLEQEPIRTDFPMKPQSVAIAEDEYGEKLIRVSTRAQARALRRVRGGS
ncbi:hypothetical protein ABH926_003819 [Catenulispora sp. GP43]|uniref:hypothetical protein n=1 Tax=Catenulispora sp. GP43 TaxID=3156263 RepID=UPI003514B879